MVHAAGGAHSVPGDGDHDPHLQNKLEKVGPQHAPQAAERDINARERHQKENADDQGCPSCRKYGPKIA